MEMTRTILTAACALALTTSFALAQPSQGQAGANTGPTSNSANSEKSSGMQNGTMNNNSGMQGGTTGMSSGGNSGMTTSGGANGNPNGMPKTTTGPTGSASKDESRRSELDKPNESPTASRCRAFLPFPRQRPECALLCKRTRLLAGGRKAAIFQQVAWNLTVNPMFVRYIPHQESASRPSSAFRTS
jgi:hypothetical protein